MSSSWSSAAFDPLELTLAPPAFVTSELAYALPAPIEPTLAIPAHVPIQPWALAILAHVPNPDGLNLDLALAPPARAPEPLNNEQWDIVKTLTESDIGSHSRLLIAKGKANHILGKLSDEEQRQVGSGNGLRVKVLDVDKNMEVFLTLKVLPSSQAHILNGQWMSGFVNRRGLKKNNVIWVRYWRQHGDEEGKILFKVLRQDPRPDPTC